MQLPELIPFFPVWLGVLAAILGSFITAVSYRLPRGESLLSAHSRCTACGTALRARDLIPLLSWVFSGGKCRHCGTKVSIRYPLTELACVLGVVGVYAWMGFSPLSACFMLLWCAIVALIVTDLEHYIILDEVQIFLVLLGIVHAVVQGFSAEAVLSAAVAGVVIGLTLKYGFLFVFGKDGLGLGDVKFLGVAGIWLADSASFVPFLFLSGVLGILSALLWRIAGRGQVFPFGPGLALAFLVCVLYPPAAKEFWQLYGFLQH